MLSCNSFVCCCHRRRRGPHQCCQAQAQRRRAGEAHIQPSSHPVYWADWVRQAVTQCSDHIHGSIVCKRAAVGMRAALPRVLPGPTACNATRSYSHSDAAEWQQTGPSHVATTQGRWRVSRRQQHVIQPRCARCQQPIYGRAGVCVLCEPRACSKFPAI